MCRYGICRLCGDGDAIQLDENHFCAACLSTMVLSRQAERSFSVHQQAIIDAIKQSAEEQEVSE